jgi:hypothetical protein
LWTHLAATPAAWDLLVGAGAAFLGVLGIAYLFVTQAVSLPSLFAIGWYIPLAVSRLQLLDLQERFGAVEALWLGVMPSAFLIGYALAPALAPRDGLPRRLTYRGIAVPLVLAYFALSAFVFFRRGSLLFAPDLNEARQEYAMPFVSVLQAGLYYLILALLWQKRSRYLWPVWTALFASSLFVHFSRGELVRLLVITGIVLVMKSPKLLRRAVSIYLPLTVVGVFLALRAFTLLGEVRFLDRTDFSILALAGSRLDSLTLTWLVVYVGTPFDLAAQNILYTDPLGIPFALIEPFFYLLQLDRLLGDPTSTFTWVMYGTLNNVGGLAPFIRDLGSAFWIEFAAYGFLVGVLWKTARLRRVVGASAIAAAFTLLIFFDAGLLANFRLTALVASLMIAPRLAA